MKTREKDHTLFASSDSTRFVDLRTRVSAQETLVLGPKGRHFIFTVKIATAQYDDDPRTEEIDIKWYDVHDKQDGQMSFPMPIGGFDEFTELLVRVRATQLKLLSAKRARH